LSRPFDQILRTPGVELEDLALAIAGEFGEVDARAAHARLDAIAADMPPVAGLAPVDRAGVLFEHLGGRNGFASDLRAGPESLLFDRVLAERRAHPLTLVIVYAAIARRTGLRLQPASRGRSVLLVDASQSPAVALDPACAVRGTPDSVTWACPHALSALLLEALASRYLERGDPASAIRSLELTLPLPLAGPIRDRARRRLVGLRARLN
jgi:hypothetical protein